jgi:signal recognition particle receptor subunit beta
MSFINYSSKEINCKIVYYGPGLSGKTTNLKYIYNNSDPETRGRLISLTGDDNRSLFFDFLPLDLGEINGFKTRFHLYTVPGQVMHESSRKLILKGVDGVVFVADSQRDRMDANKKSLEKLGDHLEDYGYEIKTLPMLFQYNKRDLPAVMPAGEMSEFLNIYSKPEIEAVAISGTGVYDTLRDITKIVLDELKSGGA